ncbi:hypothetical protein Tco_0164339 [Tanacetum coccineum]
MLVDIKFDGEVQALLLLSSLCESWSGTVTTISGSTGSTKLKFDNIRDLILREDIRRKIPEISKDKEVHMAVRDYDDTLVCCIENTVEDCIMDSSALFHATFCKEEFEKFRLNSDKTHRTYLFSLPECLKADSTVRVNQIVTVFLIESSIHLLDQNRYLVDRILIHIESRKSPTVVLFDVDTGRISIRHCEILKSITLNVLARSHR